MESTVLLRCCWNRERRNACATPTEAPDVACKRFRDEGLLDVIRGECPDRVALGLPHGWRSANAVE